MTLECDLWHYSLLIMYVLTELEDFRNEWKAETPTTENWRNSGAAWVFLTIVISDRNVDRILLQHDPIVIGRYNHPECLFHL